MLARVSRARFCLTLGALAALACGPPTGEVDDVPSVARVAALTRTNLPVRYEANRGQLDAHALFRARGRGYDLFLRPDGAVIALAAEKSEDPRPGDGPVSPPVWQRYGLAFRFVGASPTRPRGGAELPGPSNHFGAIEGVGWHTDIPGYASVVYPGLHPGVDAVFDGEDGFARLRFVLRAGADPRQIALAFTGVEGPVVDAAGRLVLATPLGDVRFEAPHLSQRYGARKREVAGRWVVRPEGSAGFEVGAYDRARPLEIDPTLSFSTYAGGSYVDRLEGLAAGDGRRAYALIQTFSPELPEELGEVLDGDSELMLARYHVPAVGQGTPTEEFLSFLGGSGSEYGSDLVRTPGGRLFVSSATSSADLPVTAGAFLPSSGLPPESVYLARFDADGLLERATYAGPCFSDTQVAVDLDPAEAEAHVYAAATMSLPAVNLPDPVTYLGDPAYLSVAVFRFDTDLSTRDYATVVGGGSSSDDLSGLAVRGRRAFVTGYTRSDDFPVTAGAYQSANAGCPQDPTRCVDAFVFALEPDGASLAFSTYLGLEGRDLGADLAVVDDPDEDVLVVGTIVPEEFSLADILVSRLRDQGGQLAWQRRLGSPEAGRTDWGVAVVLEGERAWIAGTTRSPGLATPTAFQTDLSGTGDSRDAYLARLGADGAVEFFSYLGGSGSDFANHVDRSPDGLLWLGGSTYSWNFPTVRPTGPELANYQGGDVFLALVESVPAVLSVEKEMPLVALPGEAIPVRIEVLNEGGANLVQVHDDLPNGLAWDEASLPQGCDVVSGQLQCTCSLGTNEGCVLVADAVASETGSFCNTAVAFSETGEAATSNDACVQVVSEIEPALLTVEKRALDAAGNAITGPVEVDAEVLFPISIANLGAVPVQGVELLDTLPPELGHVATTGPFDCSYDATAHAVRCSDMTITSVSGPVIRTVAREAGDGVCNRVRVVAPGAEPVEDVGGDNCVTIHAPETHLTVTKTAIPPAPARGGGVVYSLEVTNDGDLVVSGAELIDALPTGLTFGGLAPNSVAGCSESGGTITCSLPDLAPGESASFGYGASVGDRPFLCNEASVLIEDQLFRGEACHPVLGADGDVCDRTSECATGLVCGTTESLGEVESSSPFCMIPVLGLVLDAVGQCTEGMVWTSGPYCQRPGPGVTALR